MGLAKYFIKIIFDIKINIDISEISNLPNFNKFSAFFYFGSNLGPTGSKYLIKIIFDIKIEIAIFEISNMPNLNKL